MQKENGASTIIEPIDGAAPVAAPSRNLAGLPALGGICCLGVVLFLIAATIILSLIPLYTATHNAVATTKTQSFSASIPITAKNNQIADGTVLNDAQRASLQSSLQSQISSNSQAGDSTVTLDEATASANRNRRKRAFAQYFKVKGKIHGKRHDLLRLILILILQYNAGDDIVAIIISQTTATTSAPATANSG